MTNTEFEQFLCAVCKTLAKEAQRSRFKTPKEFENRVREVAQEILLKNVSCRDIQINFDPHPHAFPDIAVDKFGIEVKFSLKDTWRSVANSVLESNRVQEVEKIYLIFGKMGGDPDVKWGEYEKCVMHVRTSHVPRFEVEIATEKSLFEKMGLTYDSFRKSTMEAKMEHIRKYARGRLGAGERLWWLEDANSNEEHTLPIQVRLYTTLPDKEKVKLRAEAILLCPQIVKPGRTKNKYDDVALYLLTYYGVLAHQARDLFSAGSVAVPSNKSRGGNYVEKAIQLIEAEMIEAALNMDDALFIEYWDESVRPDDRIEKWLKKADLFAKKWVPSESLFLDYQKLRRKK